MKYFLVNSNGLFLQTMGKIRSDFSFTPNKDEALSFFDKAEADRKCNRLNRFKCRVVEI